MGKKNFYLLLSIGFFLVGCANFYLYENTLWRNLVNIAWIIIAGFYFARFLKLKKQENG